MHLRDLLLQPGLRHPRRVVAFWLLLVLAVAAPLVHCLTGNRSAVDNSVGIWFLNDDPGLKAFEENNEAFGRTEWSLLLLETASVADEGFLRDLAELTGRLENLPHVRRVLSLTNARSLVRMPDEKWQPVTLYDPAVPGAGERLRTALAASPGTQQLLLPQGWESRTAVLIQSDNFLHDPDPYRLRLVDGIHRLADDTPAVRSHSLTGTAVINAELNRSAKRDAVRFYVLVALMVLLVGWLALRDLRDLFIVAAVLAAAVAGAMGAIAAAGIPFNIVTILVPPVLISLSVCDVIHVINAFHGERSRSGAADAAAAAIRRLWTPCLWTSIVTVAGVLSLAGSTVVPIRELGLFTSLGLVLAWAATMMLVPALLVLFWKDRCRPPDAGWVPGRYAARLLPLLAGRWRWLWLVLAVLLALPAAGIPLLRVDTDYTRFFAADAPVSQAYQKMRDAGMAQSVVEIVVRSGSEGSLDSAAGSAGMQALEAQVRSLPQVRNTLSEAGLLASLQAPGASWSSVREAALSAGLTELSDFAAPDRSRQRLLVLTDYMSSHELGSFREAVERIAAAALPPAVQASVSGTTVLWANMDREIETTQVRSILVLVAVFVVLLPILFRSVLLGLLGILINGLPLAMTFGLMGMLGLKLNMATALIGGVSVGSTVDSTLFFINRFQAGRAAGLPWRDAITAAVIGVGDGILITTAIIAGGFLCMTVSSFLPTAHFGAFTCFTVLTGAFLDIVINPIILGLCAPRRRS